MMWWMENLKVLYSWRAGLIDLKYNTWSFAGSDDEQDLFEVNAEINSCLDLVDISDINEVFDRPLGR